MEKIRKMIARLYGNDVVRYVFLELHHPGKPCKLLCSEKMRTAAYSGKYNLYHCRNSFCL